MAITKKLSAIGNSLGIVIEKPILELLGFDRDTEVVMTTDGIRLIIEPADARRRRVMAAAEKVMEANAETLAKLAK